MHGKALFLGLTLWCAGTLGAAEIPIPTDLPANIAAPSAQKPGLLFTARGVQIYECRAVAGETGKYEWAFKAPEADLFDGNGNKVGHHYAGPTWELPDGGKVVGKVKAKADAPDGRGIPWLLLDATEEGGSPGKILSVQRVSTAGGLPPTEPADAAHAGQVRRVDYTATYVFYVARP